MADQTYTRNQVLAILDELEARVNKLKEIKTHELNVEEVGLIAVDAERLALHAANKDMHFSATCCITIASQMNRLLILRVAAR